MAERRHGATAARPGGDAQGGEPARGTDPAKGATRRAWATRSFAVRLAVIIVVFLMVPYLVYQQFRAADQEKQNLLLQSAQLQGELLARALAPKLEAATNGVPPTLGEDLARLVEEDVRVRLLLRPAKLDAGDGFYYVAAAPSRPRSFLEGERQQLFEAGILPRLAQTCSGNAPLAMRVPTTSGTHEVLTSITPINTSFGCWAIVTSYTSEAYLGSSIGQPYWNTPEVRAAGLIYLIMALLVTAIFVGIWRNLRTFGRIARQIGYDESKEASFSAQTTMPELHSVATDFDRLIEALRASAAMMRRAAEDNAHAFKTPIGVIRQSIEPLKRLSAGEKRGERAIYMIEQSLVRLDNLVSCAQHLDKTAADLIEPPSQQIDLSRQVGRLVGAFAASAPEDGPRFDPKLEPKVTVRAGEDLLETVIENLIDNAMRFSPKGGRIRVSVRRSAGRAELVVADEGTGVDPANLDRIFERYFSEQSGGPRRGEGGPQVAVASANDAVARQRVAAGRAALAVVAEPESEMEGEADAQSGRGADAAPGQAQDQHFGIGLWIVRRNVEAIGGRVWAENRPAGGLKVTVSLPLAR
ncbi:MAG: HAMP domain-containing sensor histidine kinase [Azospirillaceae bacterium]